MLKRPRWFRISEIDGVLALETSFFVTRLVASSECVAPVAKGPSRVPLFSACLHSYIYTLGRHTLPWRDIAVIRVPAKPT